MAEQVKKESAQDSLADLIKRWIGSSKMVEVTGAWPTFWIDARATGRKALPEGNDR